MALIATFLGGGVLFSATLVGATTPVETGELSTTGPTTNLAPGSLVTISGGGFNPGATVALTIESDPVSLGSVTASATGAITATVTIPAGLEEGNHTIKATGESPTGTLVLSQAVTTVAASTNSNSNAATTSGSNSSSAGSNNASSLGAPPNQLAFTGTSTSILLVLAAALIGAGGLLFAINRRQSVA